MQNVAGRRCSSRRSRAGRTATPRTSEAASGEAYPTQTILLAFQTFWTFLIEEQIGKKLSTSSVVKTIVGYLAQMAEEVLGHMEVLTRSKRYEQLITEMVHKRDVSRKPGGDVPA
jgi:hypothetical protein